MVRTSKFVEWDGAVGVFNALGVDIHHVADKKIYESGTSMWSAPDECFKTRQSGCERLPDSLSQLETDWRVGALRPGASYL